MGLYAVKSLWRNLLRFSVVAIAAWVVLAPTSARGLPYSFLWFAERPSSSAALSLDAGLVTHLTMFDPRETTAPNNFGIILTLQERPGSKFDYFLSNPIVIDGKSIQCYDMTERKLLCTPSSLGLIPGVSQIALLYWKIPASNFHPNGSRGTDEIVTIPTFLPVTFDP